MTVQPKEISYPLKGRTILITRTREGNVAERKKLEALGARVVELPSIELGPPSDTNSIDLAIKEISTFEWIVFTSASGVRAFFERLVVHGQEKLAIKAKFACVGPQTQKALEDEGFSATVVPKEFLTKSLGLELVKRFDDLGDKKILLARAENANPEIAFILRKAGAIVVEAPVYKTRVLERKDSTKTNLLDGITDITLTSPTTVDAVIFNFNAKELNARNIRIHCIGPVTKNRAIELGLKVSTSATEHTIDGLIEAIKIRE
jgi:uroporphyrinogen III methyltransferase/synthase